MLTKSKRKGGKLTWRLNPPEELIEAGLARPQTFHDGRTAVAAKRALEKIAKNFKEGKVSGDTIPQNPTMRMLTGHYLNSKHFNSLSSNTRDIYQRGFEDINQTSFSYGGVGNLRVVDITAQMCHSIYEYWLTNNSVAWANEKKRLWGVLFSYAMSLDIVVRNPMAHVKAVHHEPETTIWTRDQVEKFLDVAFNDFKYRSVGLLVLLCYEWGQRPVDIANLKWDNLDLTNDTASFKQQKRGAKVELPIDSTIKQILLQQKESFDFQPYVLPYLRKNDSAWRPLDSQNWSKLVAEVKELAGLPEELKVGGLRKTAIVEMVEAGLDGVGIMPVTGHKRLQSLNPYMKFTRAGAKRALDARRNQ